MHPRILALALIPVVGCSTTATISRVNGGTLEAEITGSDAEALHLNTASGAPVRVPRADVADVDHPGNAAAVVGGALSIYGILNIAAGAQNCETEGGAYCAGVFLPAAIGVPMLVWGLSVWNRSTSATRSFAPPRPGSAVQAPAPDPFLNASAAPRTRGAGAAARVPAAPAARTATLARSGGTVERAPTPAAPAPAPEPVVVPPGSSRAAVLLERYRARADERAARPPEVASSTEAPEDAEAPAAAGFQQTHWGMSPAQVRALYTDATAAEEGKVVAKRPVAGWPSVIRFDFRQEQLQRVQVQLLPASAAAAQEDAVAHFKGLLSRKYGPAVAEDAASATWESEGTRISLRRASSAEAAAILTYEADDAGEAALDEI